MTTVDEDRKGDGVSKGRQLPGALIALCILVVLTASLFLVGLQRGPVISAEGIAYEAICVRLTSGEAGGS